MDLFHQFTPDPGASGDAPRKKGLARFLELVSRDGWNFLKAGALSALCMIPAVLLGGLCISLGSLPLTMLAGIIGGLIAGPTLAGLYDTLLRALRDAAGMWDWDYRKNLKRNRRAALAPGALTGLVDCTLAYLLRVNLLLDKQPLFLLILIVVGAAILFALLTFLWAQSVLLELPFGTKLKNSFLLLFAHPVRGLIAGLIQAAFYLAFVFCAPALLILGILPGFWIVTLMGLHTVYNIVDETFAIEESIAALEDQSGEETE